MEFFIKESIFECVFVMIERNDLLFSNVFILDVVDSDLPEFYKFYIGKGPIFIIKSYLITNMNSWTWIETKLLYDVQYNNPLHLFLCFHGFVSNENAYWTSYASLLYFYSFGWNTLISPHFLLESNHYIKVSTIANLVKDYNIYGYIIFLIMAYIYIKVNNYFIYLLNNNVELVRLYNKSYLILFLRKNLLLDNKVYNYFGIFEYIYILIYKVYYDTYNIKFSWNILFGPVLLFLLLYERLVLRVLPFITKNFILEFKNYNHRWFFSGEVVYRVYTKSFRQFMVKMKINDKIKDYMKKFDVDFFNYTMSEHNRHINLFRVYSEGSPLKNFTFNSLTLFKILISYLRQSVYQNLVKKFGGVNKLKLKEENVRIRLNWYAPYTNISGWIFLLNYLTKNIMFSENFFLFLIRVLYSYITLMKIVVVKLNIFYVIGYYLISLFYFVVLGLKFDKFVYIFRKFIYITIINKVMLVTKWNFIFSFILSIYFFFVITGLPVNDVLYIMFALIWNIPFLLQYFIDMLITFSFVVYENILKFLEYKLYNQISDMNESILGVHSNDYIHYIRKTKFYIKRLVFWRQRIWIESQDLYQGQYYVLQKYIFFLSVLDKFDLFSSYVHQTFRFPGVFQEYVIPNVSPFFMVSYINSSIFYKGFVFPEIYDIYTYNYDSMNNYIYFFFKSTYFISIINTCVCLCFSLIEFVVFYVRYIYIYFVEFLSSVNFFSNHLFFYDLLKSWVVYCVTILLSVIFWSFSFIYIICFAIIESLGVLNVMNNIFDTFQTIFLYKVVISILLFMYDVVCYIKSCLSPYVYMMFNKNLYSPEFEKSFQNYKEYLVDWDIRMYINDIMYWIIHNNEYSSVYHLSSFYSYGYSFYLSFLYVFIFLFVFGVYFFCERISYKKLSFNLTNERDVEYAWSRYMDITIHDITTYDMRLLLHHYLPQEKISEKVLLKEQVNPFFSINNLNYGPFLIKYLNQKAFSKLPFDFSRKIYKFDYYVWGLTNSLWKDVKRKYEKYSQIFGTDLTFWKDMHGSRKFFYSPSKGNLGYIQYDNFFKLVSMMDYKEQYNFYRYHNYLLPLWLYNYSYITNIVDKQKVYKIFPLITRIFKKDWVERPLSGELIGLLNTPFYSQGLMFTHYPEKLNYFSTLSMLGDSMLSSDYVLSSDIPLNVNKENIYFLNKYKEWLNNMDSTIFKDFVAVNDFFRYLPQFYFIPNKFISDLKSKLGKVEENMFGWYDIQSEFAGPAAAFAEAGNDDALHYKLRAAVEKSFFTEGNNLTYISLSKPPVSVLTIYKYICIIGLPLVCMYFNIHYIFSNKIPIFDYRFIGTKIWYQTYFDIPIYAYIYIIFLSVVGHLDPILWLEFSKSPIFSAGIDTTLLTETFLNIKYNYLHYVWKNPRDLIYHWSFINLLNSETVYVDLGFIKGWNIIYIYNGAYPVLKVLYLNLIGILDLFLFILKGSLVFCIWWVYRIFSRLKKEPLNLNKLFYN